jgi:hypothetical protein
MFRAAVIALAFAATPALAAPHFHADPAARPAGSRVVARDTIWKCGDAGCAANRGNSRPATVCASLVKEVGALRSFSVAGAAIPAQDLEKCNARAG